MPKNPVPECPAPVDAGSARLIGLLASVALALVAAAHLLQLVSPLRLNHDAVRLLAMGWNAHETGSYLVDGKVEQYPHGYPFLLKLLFDFGLGRTVWINLMNLAWLGISSAGCFWIARHQAGLSAPAARLAVLLPLLSWVVVKHAVIPLTDLPYLSLSTLALLFLQRFWAETSRLAWRDLGMALILALAAVKMRTVGVALLATAAASAACHPLTLHLVPTPLRLGRKTVLVAGILGVVSFLALAQADWFRANVSNSYFHSLIAFVRGESPVSAWQVLTWRLTEASALALNFPLPANRGLLPAIPGVLALIAFAGGLLSCWNSHRPWIIYAGFYMGILLLWPFTDPRFFLPLLPLASLLAVSFGRRFCARSSGRRGLVLAYGLCFIGLGTAALGYSIRLTLAGDDFARRYGLPDVQATYAHAFGLESRPGSPPPHDRWVELLRQIEPRAKPATSSPHPQP